jgi:hypothetical protein
MDQRRIGGTGSMIPNASGGTGSMIPNASGGTGSMIPNASGGGHTTRKSRIRPMGMSMKRWKTLLRKRVGKRGTRTSRRPVTFGRTTNMITSQMMENIANTYNHELGRPRKSSYKTLRRMSSKFKKSLKAVTKQEKSKLSRIAEEHNLSQEDLEEHIDTIVEAKLSEISNLPVPVGADADTVAFINRLRNTAATGLDYGSDAFNPDYSEAKHKKYRKKFREALKKAYIMQKTHEGQNAGFGKEQGTIAYHEFMQQALIDRIHRERPNIEVDELAAMLGGIL